MAKILVVEDEDKLRNALNQGLTEQGYDVVVVNDGHDGMSLAMNESFDCILLDMMLPGCEGLEIVRTLRAVGDQTPTLILTARGAIEDRVLGLDSGADDYITKPFSWSELLARIRVCLRRNESPDLPTIRCGDLILDCIRRRLMCGERDVVLTIRQFELLEYLIRNQGRVVSRGDLARDVWREPLAELTNVIEVYVSYLRRDLRQLETQAVLQTVRGVGYRLEG